MLVRKITLIISAVSMLGLSGCAVVKTTGKVAALPFKGVYKTGELVGKGVVGTGKFAGKSVYKTGELAGKSVYYTGKYTGKGIYETGKFAGKSVATVGKGVYYMGTVPVKITDKALDTTAKVLTLTTQAADATGKVLEVKRTIQATELNAELAALKGVTGLLGVVVDAIS